MLSIYDNVSYDDNGINTFDMFGLAALIMAHRAGSYEGCSMSTEHFKASCCLYFNLQKWLKLFKFFNVFLGVKLKFEPFSELK